MPELTMKQIEATLGAFCKERIPPHIRDKVRLEFSFQGNSVLLNEERPYFQNPSQWTSSPIAKFKFDQKDKTWSLYYPDRNSKWHLYDHAKPSRQFVHLLQAVEQDPTGIFWG